MKTNLLDNKRVLIVDDEPDVLATLADFLHMCRVVKASTFEEGKNALETQYFDVAILDIMGVDGYKLLDIANKRKVITVMLTARALSPEDTAKSYREGAALYVPKEAMSDITTYLTDVFEAQEAGKHFWWRWLDRFEGYYDEKFGPDWEKDEDFWKKVTTFEYRMNVEGPSILKESFPTFIQYLLPIFDSTKRQYQKIWMRP